LVIISLLPMLVPVLSVYGAQPMEVRVQNGLVWLDLDGASLDAVVREVGQQAGFETVVIGELVTSVSLTVSAMPLSQGLDKLLANTDRIVVYAEADKNSEQGIVSLWLFSASEPADSGVGEESRGLAQTPPIESKERSLAVLRLTQKGATDDVINTLGEALLNDPHALVRSRAAVALGSLGDKRGLEMLAGALEDTNHSVRTQAAQALGQIGGPQAAQILGDVLLQNPDASMRLLAARALQREGSTQARRYLDAAAGDSDPQIRAVVQAPAGPVIERSGSPMEVDR